MPIEMAAVALPAPKIVLSAMLAVLIELDMPWSPKQHRLFEAAAHNPSVAKRVGIPQQKAQQMAGEGVKADAKAKLSAALKTKY